MRVSPLRKTRNSEKIKDGRPNSSALHVRRNHRHRNGHRHGRGYGYGYGYGKCIIAITAAIS
jgi:hypothetical protein